MSSTNPLFEFIETKDLQAREHEIWKSFPAEFRQEWETEQQLFERRENRIEQTLVGELRHIGQGRAVWKKNGDLFYPSTKEQALSHELPK